MPEPVTATTENAANSSAVDLAQLLFKDAASSARIDWSNATVAGDWVVAPLANKVDLFAQQDRHGYRYAVVHAPLAAQLLGTW